MKRIILLSFIFSISFASFGSKNPIEVMNKKTFIVKSADFVYVHTTDKFILDELNHIFKANGSYTVDNETVFYYKLTKYDKLKAVIQTIIEDDFNK